MQLIHGDCLEKMKDIPSGSVDMVLTDPPYGNIKGMGGDMEKYKHLSKSEWDETICHEKMLHECNRVLRTNGAMALFSQEPYTGKLTTQTHGNLPFSYRLTWLKDHFANCLVANKAPVSYVEDICVFFKKYDTLGQHPLRDYSIKILSFIGANLKQVNQDLGHRKAEHFFYVESTQFGLCTEETYNQLVDRYNLKSMSGFTEYSIMVDTNRRFSRRFNLPEGKKYKSNVLEYRKDYGGLHPTQKPLLLMADLIKTYTNEKETVLDFTMGSGTTGVACANLNRDFIGIEKDADYFKIATDRIGGC